MEPAAGYTSPIAVVNACDTVQAEEGNSKNFIICCRVAKGVASLFSLAFTGCTLVYAAKGWEDSTTQIACISGFISFSCCLAATCFHSVEQSLNLGHRRLIVLPV